MFKGIVAGHAITVLIGTGLLLPAQAQEHPLPTSVETSSAVLVPIAQRKQSVEIELPSSNGQTISTHALRGRVLLINFWATWCGGCKFELPWFVDFDRKYRQNGLSVVGISMDDAGMATIKQFLQSHGISYPSVIGSDKVASDFHLGSMPMSVLVDRQGRVAVQHNGVIDRVSFDEQIRTVLAER